ncbi:hypothetical protein AHiyo1_49010 [Arthrobacter sp. Hiyo1]|uniref:DNA primase/nucleoside triphosphatase C-terminal domain-containing protein n=1 Tax=Arthrobacter gyeryongensis TaxID=1650592 RepID=A0ABP9RZL7_9MICC|nr:hypothetical protein [Arthrobacter sp. Hiyo1]GAP61224.1 hypothetical protein AHiyo1_49010 [Arthrobacter sp. Hiyo1]
MLTSHFQQFLSEATVRDPGAAGDLLGPDSFYGLYVSWCLAHGISPVPETDFGAGMRRCGVDVHRSGLAMTGPAAADYILASDPGMS